MTSWWPVYLVLAGAAVATLAVWWFFLRLPGPKPARLDIPSPHEIGGMLGLIQGRRVVLDPYHAPLACYGCMNSASYPTNGEKARYPGIPSGERACFFCIRNPERARDQREFEERTGGPMTTWYDGRPMQPQPLDLYCAVDRFAMIDPRRHPAVDLSSARAPGP
jgi:hypothetical protein